MSTIEFVNAYFQTIKSIFPGITLSEIQIEQENGKMALIKFSKEEVGESTGEFALLPSGKYIGQICNHEWKETKSGGHLLALTLEITDGAEGVGRKVFDNLNLDCASEEAQKIALRSYKSICFACNAESYYDGIFELDNDDDAADYFAALPENLYGNDIALTVGVEKGKDNYPDKNKIKMYATPTAPATAPKTAAPAAKKPSWARG